MTDNILYHLPNQPQQGYKPSSNGPPKGYEEQFQNPKYYKGNDWSTMNDPQNDQQSDQYSNVNYRQKEFLKGEYSRQLGEQQRKKDDVVRQKETDLILQQQLKKEYDNDVLREKQQLADKKRAMAEMYKVQIEQQQRDKVNKKQQQIVEDRNRLQYQDDGRRDDYTKNIKEDLRRDMIGYQLQTDQRIQQELLKQNEQNVQPQFEIGGENQQMEKYERIQNVNARNFISYDDEKRRKADAFTNAQGGQAPYGAPSRQYNDYQNAQYYEKANDKREYNDQLKRQMAENEQKKAFEKQDRQRGYEFDQVSRGQGQGYQQQQQQQQQQQVPASRQKQFDQEYDIMGNQKTYQQSSKNIGDNRKDDQSKYRQILDMQIEQNRMAKMKEEQGYYQPPPSQQQYSNNPTKNVPQQGDFEYDVMGNQRQVYNGQSQGNSQKDQRKEDQQKYREMLDLQREQSKFQKQKDDDEFSNLERKYNGLNIGRQIVDQKPKIYNPISNTYSYKENPVYKYNDENKYQQQASQQRIDYSALANKNILSHNY